MSDALSDIAKDSERARLITEYFNTLVEFASGRAGEQEVRDAASSASGGRHGYFSGPVDLESEIEEVIEGIKNRDKQIWAKVLWKAFGYYNYRSLAKLSPFRDEVIVRVDYGVGFASYESYPDSLLPKSIIDNAIKDKDWVTYDCDDYLVVFDGNEVDEVYWIRCGTYYGIETEGRMVHYSLKRPRLKSDWDGSQESRRKYCLQTKKNKS